jgi:formate/nitrite transporter FocA (FNT family)
MLDHPGWVILLSAVLAGWLMGLLSWLVAASRDTISQIVIVWLVTVTIGFCHLHHSVVGTAEALAGIFSGSGVTFADFGRSLGLSTLGNALGGFFFVALIKWGHARASSDRG